MSNTNESQPNDDGVVKPSMMEVNYEYTPVLAEILTHLNSSLLITTYQAGKLMVLGVRNGQLNISFLDYDQPMGVAVRPDRIALGTRRQIHFLIPAHETISPSSEPDSFNGCFVPKASAYTGAIHGHDLAWGNEGLWVVNTLFSCLCTLHDKFSFVPRWQPKFVTQLIDQDRCHLNGLAMDRGVPRFVTAMAESNEAGGWRPTKAHSGVVIDIASNETISRGYAMPHSPRLYQDRLWVLNSGCGSIGYVDSRNGQYQEVEKVPGYTRGLAFQGQFAFVGLSKIRETSVFGGVPIAEKRNELRCGIGVIDLVTGKTVAVFQFHSGVSEIFAVDVIPNISNPQIAGASMNKNEHDVWIVPAPNSSIPPLQPNLPLYATSPANLASAAPQQVGTPPASALADLAMQRHMEGKLAEAAALFQQAIERDANQVAIWVNFGNLRQDQGDQFEALRCYENANRIDPQNVPALQNLGYLLFNMGFAERAQATFHELLKLVPTGINYLLASAVLPVIYDSELSIKQWRETQAELLQTAVQKGLTVDATKLSVPTNFFWAYQAKNDVDVMKLRSQIIRGRQSAPHPNKPKNGGKLKVGFLSAYFRDHTIGRLNIGRIERLNRDQFDVTVITTGRHTDAMAQRFQAAADRFVVLPRDVPGAMQALDALNLDVLFFADVGMDALTSTLAFSRFAPIQMTTWGHPDTTGSPTLDYFVSSELLESDQAEHHYTENLVKLANLGTYYERPVRTAPQKTKSDFGIPDDRHVYLCPQTLFKFHPDFDWALSEILRRDPRGELVILEGRLPEWTNRLSTRWRHSQDLSSDRVRFLPAQSNANYLELLAMAEVNLDPFHFGGGNSSYESLAVGTPVVTLPGEFLRGRITTALYRKMQFTDLVARDMEHFVSLAVKLGTDPNYRRQCSQAIIDASDRLFEDGQEVDVFGQAIREIVISRSR